MQTCLMELKNLSKTYGGGLFRREQTAALKDFSLSISADQPLITTIAGESGSGKTTLANLILGFVTPTEGQILHEGIDIYKASRQEWTAYRQDVQGIFQDPYGTYNPFYKVDNVFDMVIGKFKLASNKAEARRITEDALEIVGMRPDEILGKFPHQLSGGQRQRIMVARAFLLKPRLMVADEPVSMIDASLQVRVLDIFTRLRDDFGISFLYITHDLSTAYQISDDIYILYQGYVMEKGDIDGVMQNPQHPYTELLLHSIPTPDPDVRWEGRLDLTLEDEMLMEDIPGCTYYRRCPYRMDKCRETLPPMYEVGENHWAACYLRA